MSDYSFHYFQDQNNYFWSNLSVSLILKMFFWYIYFLFLLPFYYALVIIHYQWSNVYSRIFYFSVNVCVYNFLCGSCINMVRFYYRILEVHLCQMFTAFSTQVNWINYLIVRFWLLFISIWNVNSQLIASNFISVSIVYFKWF